MNREEVCQGLLMQGSPQKEKRAANSLVQPLLPVKCLAGWSPLAELTTTVRLATEHASRPVSRAVGGLFRQFPRFPRASRPLAFFTASLPPFDSSSPHRGASFHLCSNLRLKVTDRCADLAWTGRSLRRTWLAIAQNGPRSDRGTQRRVCAHCSGRCGWSSGSVRPSFVAPEVSLAPAVHSRLSQIVPLQMVTLLTTSSKQKSDLLRLGQRARRPDLRAISLASRNHRPGPQPLAHV